MELLQPNKPLEFVYKDVTFMVKSQCSAGDRAEILLAGENKGNGQVEYSRPAYMKTVLRRMVVGWRGVTVNGQEVPYAWELFDQRFPKDDGIMLELFNFVVEHTDLGKHKETVKNESRERPNGSHGSAHSPALDKTAAK